MTLDKVRDMAQRDADRTRRTLAIYNLNPYSPLYVIRDAPPPSAVPPRSLVEIVAPALTPPSP